MRYGACDTSGYLLMAFQDDHDAKAFAEKLAHWRKNGVPVQYTYGREAFHGPTGRELGQREIDLAKAKGEEIEPVGYRRSFV